MCMATRVYNHLVIGQVQCGALHLPQCKRWYSSLLAVWLSGNTLASINVVALRQTQLVPGWVTICGQVNHLSM